MMRRKSESGGVRKRVGSRKRKREEKVGDERRGE